MDQSLVASIRDNLNLKSTAELRQAYESGDKSAWSPEALEAMRQLLDERAKGTATGSSSSPDSKSSGNSIGNFFLSVGAVICVLGCIFTVLRTLYGLGTLTQVGGFITVSRGDSALLIAMILVDGFVWFCLSAALLVVFVRVSRLDERGGAERNAATSRLRD